MLNLRSIDEVYADVTAAALRRTGAAAAACGGAAHEPGAHEPLSAILASCYVVDGAGVSQPGAGLLPGALYANSALDRLLLAGAEVCAEMRRAVAEELGFTVRSPAP